MNQKDFFKVMGRIDDDLIMDAGMPVKKPGAFLRRRLIPAAACLIIILFVAALAIKNGNNSYLLISGNIRVKYIDKAPEFNISYSLAERLTEEELFHKYNTDIFKGTVKEIKNIVISFRGRKDYRAIAKIEISKSYRGNNKEGDTVSVLLPFSVNTGMKVEDTEVISQMKAGMEGIFMPLRYGETSVEEENGEKLYVKDLAEYGFMDGVRFAFLQTENGLVFDRDSYGPIADAVSLEEIEAYVNKMIEYN